MPISKNKIFQTLYFIVRPARAERTDFVLDFENYDRRYFTQAKLANLFGGPEIILYGNSNIEFQNGYEYMSRYPCVAINCGIAGSLATHLYEYLSRDAGIKLRSLFLKKKKPVEVINAFGDHVIQRKMDTVDIAIARLKSIMPYSYCVGMPPIHSSQLSMISGFLGNPISKQEIDHDVKILNGKLWKAWGDRFIDVYPHLLDQRTGEAYPGILQDEVHYSEALKKLYVSMISALPRAV